MSAANERFLFEALIKDGSQKEHPSFFLKTIHCFWFIMSLSFDSPKESNQRKRARKRQPHPVCPPATQGLNGATKQDAVRTFSGLPTHLLKL